LLDQTDTEGRKRKKDAAETDDCDVTAAEGKKFKDDDVERNVAEVLNV